MHYYAAISGHRLLQFPDTMVLERYLVIVDRCLLQRGLCGHVHLFFSSRRRHTRCYRDWSSDVCSSDLMIRHTRATVTGVQTCALPILLNEPFTRLTRWRMR